MDVMYVWHANRNADPVSSMTCVNGSKKRISCNRYIMVDSMIQDRETSRRFFLEVWNKHKSGLPLQPLEAIVLGVLQEHPEYHFLLQDNEELLRQEFAPDRGVVNPFLHMGMHIAI